MPYKKHQKYRHLPAFILLVLAKGPAHGGAIFSIFNQELPHLNTDTAAIYRSLQQLEEEGAVIFSWDTSNPGPARKIYTLTNKGWEQLDNWKQDIEDRMTNLKYFLDSYRELKRN